MLKNINLSTIVKFYIFHFVKKYDKTIEKSGHALYTTDVTKNQISIIVEVVFMEIRSIGSQTNFNGAYAEINGVKSCLRGSCNNIEEAFAKGVNAPNVSVTLLNAIDATTFKPIKNIKLLLTGAEAKLYKASDALKQNPNGTLAFNAPQRNRLSIIDFLFGGKIKLNKNVSVVEKFNLPETEIDYAAGSVPKAPKAVKMTISKGGAKEIAVA